MSRHHRQLHAGRWSKVRREVLERDGWRCRTCGRYGNEVDHIVPLAREPGRNPYDDDNLQALCQPCHKQKTAAENGRELSPDEAAWRHYLEAAVRD